LKEKNLLRKKIQQIRDCLSEKERIAASEKIADRFFKTKEYRNAKNIFIFYPFRSEIDTTIIIKKAVSDGKRIILPKVAGEKLKLFFIDKASKQLKPGAYGIMEPCEDKCKQAKISQINLAVIPGICFDRNCNRLGYGRGFYDKIIPQLPVKTKRIALCFHIQMIKKVPVERHDSKVDKIITEENIYE